MRGVWSVSVSVGVSVCVLGLAALGVQAAVVLENGLPILWEQASGRLADLPQVDSVVTVVTVDPWDYRQRMGLYRLLLNATGRYMSCMGANATDSPLWELPMQLGWMLRSGRLLDPIGVSICGHATGDKMCISGLSYWACNNYQLSVIPFLAAVQEGVIGDSLLQVQLQTPSEDYWADYCTSYSDCSATQPEPLAKWEAFFQGLRNVSGSPITDFEKRDQILGLLWEAKAASLEQARKCNRERLLSHTARALGQVGGLLPGGRYTLALRKISYRIGRSLPKW